MVKSKSIICRFGIPQSIVSDNDRQFDNQRLKDLCKCLGLKNQFSTPHHPQSNSQVEAVNKVIKHSLKTRLDQLKGNWAEEFPEVLWSYYTIARTTTGETLFRLSFGVDVVILVEIGMHLYKVLQFEEQNNEKELWAELDLADGLRQEAENKNITFEQRAERYYDQMVKIRKFRVGDLVLRELVQGMINLWTGTLGPNWDGPYKFTKCLPNGVYEFEDGEERKLRHH